MTKHFNYWLTGTGWAEIFLTSDKQSIRFEFSYLNDSLADLLGSLCRLIQNQSNLEKIIFPEEPGQYSLIISKLDKDTIKLELFDSDEWEQISEAYHTPNSKKLVYSDLDTLKNFGLVVCEGIERLLERHSLSEYKEKWSLSEFPMSKFEELRKYLSSFY